MVANFALLVVPQAELSTIRKQLLEEFSADDACPLGSHSNESTSQSPAYNAKLHQKSLEVINLVYKHMPSFYSCFLILLW